MRGRDNKLESVDRWERKDWWGVVLEAPDPGRLLHFYSDLLDVPIYNESDDGGSLDFGQGVAYLAIQKADVYEPPVWPPAAARRACSCTWTSRSPIWPPPPSTRSSWGRRWPSTSRRTTCACCSTRPVTRSACMRDRWLRKAS